MSTINRAAAHVGDILASRFVQARDRCVFTSRVWVAIDAVIAWAALAQLAGGSHAEAWSAIAVLALIGCARNLVRADCSARTSAPASLQTARDVEELRRALLAVAFAMGAQPGAYNARFVADLLAASGVLWPDLAGDRPPIITQLLDQLDEGAEYLRAEPIRGNDARWRKSQ